MKNNFSGRLARLLLAAVLSVPAGLKAQNPYLPMWEYIPDGEPHLFEDPDCPGRYRVYVYGSHDVLRTAYCGRDQVVWSASADDLSAWRFDGVIFESRTRADGTLLKADGTGDVLYAPDVAEAVGPDGRRRYYLYPNNQESGRQSMVCVSDRPDGPFEVCNWNPGRPGATEEVLGFDPAVLVDDDGRVYGFWGFQQSYAAELDPATMATVKPGTEIITDLIPNLNQPGPFRFFEASSIRKIADKYVFIYSRTTADGEFGLPASNYTLAYAYSDHPLGPYTYGGTLIDARARSTDSRGKTVCTANPYGNTHGSILCIDGRWWVFYHRQTGTDEYSRQAMAAPVEVKVERGPGGKVSISEAEYNSEGFRTEGLDPLSTTPAGWACYYTHPEGIGQDYPHFIFNGSYIRPSRIESGRGTLNPRADYCPVVNNTHGSVVGYKYFNMNRTATGKPVALRVSLLPQGVDGTVTVWTGGPSESEGGTRIARFDISAAMPQVPTELTAACAPMKRIRGRQPLYFVFESASAGASICELHSFRFEL